MSDKPSGSNLRLHVSIGEITIDVSGPVDDAETWFEALREDYLGNVDPETVVEATTRTKSLDENPDRKESEKSSSEKSRSLTEYYKLAESPMKRDTALIVGWYLEHQEGKSDFTQSEIEKKARDAKVKLGANVSRDLSKQVEQGFIEKVNERDGDYAYYLTITGEDYIQEELLEL